MSLPNCPECNSEYTYEDRHLIVCPECAHEWDPNAAPEEEAGPVYKDAFGNILQDGDTVTVIKDLKVKGSSNPIKQGTTVKDIRLKEGDHDIDCKVPGFGAMELKTQFVKKI
ncbi:zinc ribbon domain-containing protein YjdM [Savagea faecisuis]|uniref:Zinc ribbon domain-containing protein YjdM n=1 Tax=Savagea faecisuis TaxID=1274803 RepID=A0ABW3H2Q7_9BACL